MKRILILGCCGAGKTTLARKIENALKIEVIHLDKHYWKPNWVESEQDEWKAKVKELIQRDQWIMDGNYGSSLDISLERADTVIFLNYPTHKCLYRVLKRTYDFYGKTRPDMPNNCPERLDFPFLHYVATYNIKRGKKISKKLKSLKNTKNVFIFKNDAQTASFLEKI